MSRASEPPSETAFSMNWKTLLALAFGAFTAVAAADSEPILLWKDKPPRALAEAPTETVDENGRIPNVSVPSIVRYLPAAQKRPCTAIIICAGRGYGSLD